MGPSPGEGLRPWRGVEVPQLLRDLNLIPKKSLGQSFLISDYIADKIADAAGLGPEVLEIGPGTGMLTARLAQRFQHVTAVDIDRRLKPLHELVVQEFPNVRFVYADFLKYEHGPVSTVVGNLPYYITTPILEKIFLRMQVQLAVIMVQKELGQRMAATPRTKAYGALSIFVQSYSIPEVLFPVSRANFYPLPQVDSVVLRLTIKAPPDVNPAVLENVVKTAFQQRRKRLRNALRKHPDLLQLAEEAGINADLRPEEIPVSLYLRWAALVTSRNKGQTP
ncbi:ribosomal RNA small subunit methyltransferase A [Coprothermobacteraceae bacterium]|nr:ribosomal RNA small subunit methyltransferase A [Coprothermobacteraceae bacterium]